MNNKKMSHDFFELAESFLRKGHSHQLVTEAMGDALLRIVSNEDETKRKLILEAVYAEIAKVLERDASKK